MMVVVVVVVAVSVVGGVAVITRVRRGVRRDSPVWKQPSGPDLARFYGFSELWTLDCARTLPLKLDDLLSGPTRNWSVREFRKMMSTPPGSPAPCPDFAPHLLRSARR